MLRLERFWIISTIAFDHVKQKGCNVSRVSQTNSETAELYRVLLYHYELTIFSDTIPHQRGEVWGNQRQKTQVAF